MGQFFTGKGQRLGIVSALLVDPAILTHAAELDPGRRRRDLDEDDLPFIHLDRGGASDVCCCSPLTAERLIAPRPGGHALPG